MGFFRRSVPSQPQFPPLGSGRRLRSALALTDCLAHLEAILLGYRPSTSAYRTPYVSPGWRWNGPQEQPPQAVISFDDSNNDFLLAAFWPEHSGTECGLFPLGSGDQRLSALPIIGHWKQRDASLTSIGVVPGGQITLAPPRLPDKFFDEMLRTAGFPSTSRNLETLGMKISQMFLARAHQFIASKDPRSAERFIQSHVFTGGPSRDFCQRVLDDLAAWNPGVLPYIQDTPMRVRAISLEALNVPGSMWDELEQPEMATDPNNDPEVWVGVGIDHLQHAHYTESLAAYERALQLNPTYVPAYVGKGYVFIGMERYEEGLAAFDHALKLGLADAPTYAGRGDALTRLNRYEEALAAYDQSLQLDPAFAETYASKSQALSGLKRYEEALTACDQAIQLKPTLELAYVYKSEALIKLKRYAEAVAACDWAIQLNPAVVLAYAYKGDALTGLKRYAEALAAWDGALALSPTFVAAWINKGAILRALGRVAEAEVAEQQARELGDGAASPSL